MAMGCAYCEWLLVWSRTACIAFSRGGIVYALALLLRGSPHITLLKRKDSVTEREPRSWMLA